VYVSMVLQAAPDGRNYVLSWSLITGNPTEISGIYYHIDDVPKDFYKNTEYWYIKDGKLRRNKYRQF